MGDTCVIDIVAQVSDQTKAGTNSAVSSASRIENAAKRAAAEITKLRKMSKIEIAMYAVDKASKIMNSVWNTGKNIAGKVFKFTLKAVDLVTAPLQGIMRMLANPIVAMAGVAGVGLGVSDLVNTYRDFEQGMANVRAITRATDEDMESLTATAKKLGEETMFSASQVAQAMEFLAMAGWKTKDITGGMQGLLDLAAAGGVDVATAADVVSSALAQFGMRADESSRVADVLAATATSSKTDVYGLGESLKYAGTSAGSMGYDIADVALGFGLMGNVDLSGSMAGTAMRSLISRIGGMDAEEIAGEGDKIAAAMKKLGVSAYDAQGKAKPLITVMRDLRKGFSGLSESETQSVAQDLAGMYGKSGLLAIVNATEDEFNELAGVIDNSLGLAQENAEIRMDSLQGSMYYLQSAAEGVKLAFMDRLAPYLRSFLDWITTKMPDIQNAAVSFADSIANAIDRAKSAVEKLINSPEWQSAGTLWEKLKVAWDKLIAQPFDEWWNSTGKAWLAAKAKGIGDGIGTAIRAGVNAIFGGSKISAVEDGLSIGSSFATGFTDGIKGIDWEQVTKGLSDAIVWAIQTAFSNPVTGTLAASWIGGKVLGGVTSAVSLVRGAKTVAAASAPLVQSAGMNAGMAGLLLGSKATSGMGLMAAGTAGVAGGVTGAVTLVSAVSDYLKSRNSTDRRESAAYKESAAQKVGGVAVGAAAGLL